MPTRADQGGYQSVVEADWSEGMFRDTARIAIPQGGVFDAADFLLDLPGVARKRGGTVYAGPAFGAGARAEAVAYAEFPAGGQLIGWDENGNAYKVAAGSTVDLVGTDLLARNAVLRFGGGTGLLVYTKAGAAPVKYDGTAAPSALGGTPPSATFAEVYKTRLLLAGTSTNPQRIFFSPTPDIATTWDTTNSWVDALRPITGLAALNNVVFVFQHGNIERLIGATPPPNSDMDLAPFAAVGCTDSRSIVVSDGYVYFANTKGVYRTNGGPPECLTDQGGIGTYWRSLFAGYDPATWYLTAGMYGPYLFVGLLDNSRALVASLMCNVPRRAWWRTTNIKPTMFARARGVAEELYYADATVPRIVALSGIFTPTVGNANDANGAAVAPAIEFRPVGDGPTVKSFGFGRVTFDMRNGGGADPQLAVTVKTGLLADGSSSPDEGGTLAVTSTVARKRFAVNKNAQAVTVALAQTGASAKTELYAVEVEQQPGAMNDDGVG